GQFQNPIRHALNASVLLAARRALPEFALEHPPAIPLTSQINHVARIVHWPVGAGQMPLDERGQFGKVLRNFLMNASPAVVHPATIAALFVDGASNGKAVVPIAAPVIMPDFGRNSILPAALIVKFRAVD